MSTHDHPLNEIFDPKHCYFDFVAPSNHIKLPLLYGCDDFYSIGMRVPGHSICLSCNFTRSPSGMIINNLSLIYHFYNNQPKAVEVANFYYSNKTFFLLEQHGRDAAGDKFLLIDPLQISFANRSNVPFSELLKAMDTLSAT